MKKILIITQYFPPESVGRASRIYEMAKYLKKSNDVRIVCPPPTYPFTKYNKVNYLFHKESFDDLNITRVWTYQPSKINLSIIQRGLYLLIFPILTGFAILKSLPKISTVIISIPPLPVLLTSLICRLFRKKIIIDVGDFSFEMGTYSASRKKYKFLRNMMKKFEIHSYKKSNAVIINRLAVSETLKKILGKDCPTIEYFPFQVDLNSFKKYDEKILKQIVYVGNFGPAQDIQTLIKAMSLVSKKFPDYTLQLYGGGDRELELRELVKELNLEKYCIFNNPVPRKDIPKILSRSSIGVIPLAMDDSLKFALPSKTFEYMACELPIFAYGSSDELEKILQISKSGRFVKSNDPQKIAEELISLLGNENDLKIHSKSGREYLESSQNVTKLNELI